MIFLDTSFIVALDVERDAHHIAATQLFEKLFGQDAYEMPLISDYIFDESVTVAFGRTKSLAHAAKLGERLAESFSMKRVDTHTFAEAWRLFCNQKNTALSFTDCTTIALMRQKSITQIATFDEDFKKVAGITVL